jgi:small subunit ribosomal protein S17
MSEATQTETAPAEATPAEAGVQGKLRTMTGKVVSAAMDKTAAVAVERLIMHPMYGKYIRRTTKLLAHDEQNDCRVGDTVEIAECRPISRRKSWRVVNVVQRAEAE